MKKVRAIIFDMDGVLVDTEPFHQENEKRMFQKLGLSISAEEHSNFTGLANDLMWEHLSGKHDLPFTAAELTAMTISQGIAILNSLENLHPSPGLVELLEKLTALKLPLAVGTSSDSQTMNLILKKSGLLRYFQATVSRNDVEKSKPAPDVFLKAAGLLKMNAGDCVVVEDSLNGVKAARAAGMYCIVYTGNGSSEKAKLLANHQINSFAGFEHEIAALPQKP